MTIAFLDSDAPFALTMGVQPLHHLPLIALDLAQYHSEIALKTALLRRDAAYYAQALPNTEALQWEALRTVLQAVAHCDPQHATLDVSGDQWRWHNQLQHAAPTCFRYGDTSTLGAPLAWAATEVQEDLLVLSGDEQAGFPLVAGVLCFANMWSLEEKLGLPLLAIHGPVPGYAEYVGHSTNMLMARLKADRPVWRSNWSIMTNNWLDLSTRHAAANAASKLEITEHNAGERCWLRVERQCFARLPISGGVLFTIHTYQTQLSQLLAATPNRAQRLFAFLNTIPQAMRDYKGITPFYAPLCAYLTRSEF